MQVEERAKKAAIVDDTVVKVKRSRPKAARKARKPRALKSGLKRPWQDVDQESIDNSSISSCSSDSDDSDYVDGPPSPEVLQHAVRDVGKQWSPSDDLFGDGAPPLPSGPSSSSWKPPGPTVSSSHPAFIVTDPDATFR